MGADKSAQKIASGLKGDPVPPGNLSGAATTRNSQDRLNEF
jgi:hypothetical protein